jgi:hypothetical protein
MMTPLRFQQLYEAEWTELQALLEALSGATAVSRPRDGVSGARAAALYRQACEHLALARARSYPTYIVDRLEDLTSRAHQLIYQQREFGLGRLRRLINVDFPAAVRDHSSYVAVAAATFLLPTILVGVLVYSRPEMILSVVSSDTVSEFEEMYSTAADSIGRTRGARLLDQDLARERWELCLDRM